MIINVPLKVKIIFACIYRNLDTVKTSIDQSLMTSEHIDKALEYNGGLTQKKNKKNFANFSKHVKDALSLSKVRDGGGWRYSDIWDYSDNLCFKFYKS